MSSQHPQLCPCSSGLPYARCCRPYHAGEAAPTPQALMRSRYSAYALNKPDYVMATTHPDSPHWQADRAAWRADLQAFSSSVTFVGLKILLAEGDTVKFRAVLMQGGRDVSFTEHSIFRQHNGRWLYVKGQ
jgi:SEC-C motif-containing protein